MSNKKTQRELGQFFTPAPVAELVTKYVSEDIASAVDLAAGFGDLLLPVHEKNKGIEICAVDIDPVSVKELKRQFPLGDVKRANALKLRGNTKKWLTEQEFDLVVGNPPFNKQDASNWSIQIIQDQLGIDLSNYSTIRAEVAFIALSLLSAKKSGYISLVLPKTIAIGESWCWLRKILLEKHSIIAAATLPSGAFSSTEVETCVLTLQKGRVHQKDIKIIECDRSGCELNSLYVSKENAKYRLDYDYHNWRIQNKNGNSETLAQAGVEVVRGNIHFKKARDMGIDIFHTSNFTKLSEGGIAFPEGKDENLGRLVSVGKGDILIPRVGRNLNQVAKVLSGHSIISDCVFGLKAPDSKIDDLQRCLESEKARGWIKVHTSGSCAKIISKTSLLNMPLN
ncbi:class I SAM-dependent DNA methyltransferase [Bermanella sp. R86510]|uniref:HsdM family class I SAM-dependent methyltransferase n=1 Tax=unclassified Bermanella TaxID=2627862 RepID=UPI0037CA5B5B